jgi:protein-S-isoprenylcysteine O-methyltransferase Ste14
MIRKLGDFFFRYRNLLFPLFFIVLAVGTRPMPSGGIDEDVRYAAGIAIALMGQLLRALTIGLAYIVRGGKHRKVYAAKLVTDGIFAHSRNPLYLGNILIVIGLSIVAHSFYFYLIGIPAFLFVYYAIVVAEEAYLGGKFGEAYWEYCRDVNRFIPSPRGLLRTIGGMGFRWQRLVVKEYGTTFTWIGAVILLMMKNRILAVGMDAAAPDIRMLFRVFLFATLLWASARFLKKRRIFSGD